MTLVGVDVGGTFTDLIAIDLKESERQIRIAKVPSTRANQADGVMAALRQANVDLAATTVFVHGTTTTTNALLERKIARTGLITTAGFRDILELGRRTRPNAYGMIGVFEPLISREHRLEVPERVDAQGSIVTPLDEDAVEHAASRLIDMGCETIVIHFLHAYANPTHEKRAGEIVRSLWPNDYVTCGHEVLTEFREFERGTTAAVSACIQPVLQRYVERLAEDLNVAGFGHDLLLMQGNGGTIAAREAPKEAAKTVMSGPASGVMAAAFIGSNAGYDSLITYDMGGTSSDVALIRGGTPAVSDELELEYSMPIHVPMVDVHTIGAGGGSIAWIDDGGMLRVGPQSAGADPGPICYGRGGSRPTITDANLVLGRLNPRGLLSVGEQADVEEIEQSIARQIGKPLQLDPKVAAAAILTIANDRMAGAIRMVSLARGHDPRDYALFAFGGAGPLHATALAHELGIPKVIVPPRPGITNAIGCIVADVRHDMTQTINQPIDDTTPGRALKVLNQQVEHGREIVSRQPVQIDDLREICSADMQYRGQTHVLNVPINRNDLREQTLRRAFEKTYFERFAIELPEMEPVLVNLKTSVIGKRADASADLLSQDDDCCATLIEAQIGERLVWFDGKEQLSPIYRRERLPRASQFAGPAIIEQLDATTIVTPNDHATRDASGNLVITVG